jgi:hypothetical protein
MRILVIIIAILALLSGLAHLAGSMISLFFALMFLTVPSSPEIEKVIEMSSFSVGMYLNLIGFLMLVNGLLFTIFAIGAILRKPWARFLGIAAYTLNIVVLGISIVTSRLPEGSPFPYIFGTFMAMAFIVILLFSKSAFEKAAPKLETN